ncbi:unnamed protein product [Urochloa humidicola]
MKYHHSVPTWNMVMRENEQTPLKPEKRAYELRRRDEAAEDRGAEQKAKDSRSRACKNPTEGGMSNANLLMQQKECR